MQKSAGEVKAIGTVVQLVVRCSRLSLVALVCNCRIRKWQQVARSSRCCKEWMESQFCGDSGYKTNLGTPFIVLPPVLG